MSTKKKHTKPEPTKLLTNGPNGQKPAFGQVATCAYFIWVRRGRTDGHELDDWLEAERQLTGSNH
jgi:hypothetical protein